eukprot:gene5979-5271_t
MDPERSVQPSTVDLRTSVAIAIVGKRRELERESQRWQERAANLGSGVKRLKSITKTISGMLLKTLEETTQGERPTATTNGLANEENQQKRMRLKSVVEKLLAQLMLAK